MIPILKDVSERKTELAETFNKLVLPYDTIGQNFKDSLAKGTRPQENLKAKENWMGKFSVLGSVSSVSKLSS